jgi:hypothetical protein
MDVKVQDIKIEGDYCVQFDVSNAPKLQETYSTVCFQPERVCIRYSFNEYDVRWECTQIRVTGHRYRQDGSMGQRTGDRLFLTFNSPMLPEWLSSLVDEYRPSYVR